MKKRELANELAARLDAELLEPADGDSAEMRDLLAAYACLEDAAEDPNPKLQRWVKRLLKERSARERVSAWVKRFRERWLAWLPRRYHPALAGVTVVAVVLIAALAFLGTPRRLNSTADSGGAYFDALARSDADDVRYERANESVPLPGAAQARERGYASSSVTSDDAEAQGQFGFRLPAADGSDAWAGHVAADAESDDGRMVVRRASLAFVVEDAEASFERVQEIAAEHGGGVYSLETGQTAQGSLQTFVSIEVPVAACDRVLAQLRGMDAELLSEQVTSQDVTAEYVDLDARVRNLELAEQELQELLEAARERGEKAQGILSIYNELTNIRQQIEQLKGQMTLLEHSAALARIDVALIPQEVAPAPPGFDAGRVLREAWEDVVHIFEDIAAFFIRAFAYAPLVLPPTLVVALVAWLVVRRARRHAAVANEGDGRDE